MVHLVEVVLPLLARMDSHCGTGGALAQLVAARKGRSRTRGHFSSGEELLGVKRNVGSLKRNGKLDVFFWYVAGMHAAWEKHLWNPWTCAPGRPGAMSNAHCCYKSP